MKYFVLFGWFFLFSALAFSHELNCLNTPQKTMKAYKFIVLHTTEGNDFGSDLAHLKKDKSAHFLVGQEGQIGYVRPITHRVCHAGLSLWNGVKYLNQTSIGIEITGKHTDENVSLLQLKAVRHLIFYLRLYLFLVEGVAIPDTHIVTHSNVAINPDFKTRGRKGCAMNWAGKGLREYLGLNNSFKMDPDLGLSAFKDAQELKEILYPHWTPEMKWIPKVERGREMAWTPELDLNPEWSVQNFLGPLNFWGDKKFGGRKPSFQEFIDFEYESLKNK